MSSMCVVYGCVCVGLSDCLMVAGVCRLLIFTPKCKIFVAVFCPGLCYDDTGLCQWFTDADSSRCALSGRWFGVVIYHIARGFVVATRWETVGVWIHDLA